MSVHIAGPPLGPCGDRINLPLLRRRARRILRALKHADSELSFSLVDDEEIAELNATWRQRRGATDVLSFSLLEGQHAEHRGALLGDVVISVETAARQARARHRSLDEEVSKLLIHGVLHLVGHDHQDDDEARRMRAEERRLWQRCRE